MVNQFLKQGESVVFVDHKYNENDGAYSIATIWTGNGIRQENYANGYNNGSFRDAEVNATPEQLAASIEWYKANAKDTNRSTFVGCTVILSRSRKAPNKTPLKVVGFSDRYYNETYNNYTQDQICVELENKDRVWVSTGCIADVVEYCAPIWA